MSTGSATSYRSRLAGNVSRYSAANLEPVLALRRALFGEGPQCDPAYFRWQFEDNPSNEGAPPQLWIYAKGGQILGEQGGIPVALRVGSATYRGSWAIDLVVRPEHKLRGIGAVLSETYVAENEVTIGLSVSEEARRAFLRAGWIDLGTLPLHVRPLETKELLSLRWRERPGRWAGQALDVPLRSIDGLAGLSTKLAGVQLAPIHRFDARADVLWETAARSYKVIGRRRAEDLNWRYFTGPQRGRYRGLYLYSGERVVGYAVLRVGEWRGAKVGYVIDYLCAPRWIPALFVQCLRYFRRHEAAAVYCLHAGAAAAQVLPWLGFLTRDSHCRLMVRPGASVPIEARTMLMDPSSWFVTYGDSDVDHPRAP